MNVPLSRRDLVKLLSAVVATAPLALAASDPGAPVFFTKDEFLLLDTLAEMIIPEDDHSPGAHAAGVAVYIDRITAEAFLPEAKKSWRDGLASVNDLSRTMHGKAFLSTSKEEQTSILERLAAQDNQEPQGRKAPKTRFFGQLKNTVVLAYYSSEIGIHKETEYQGNVLLNQFVGYLPDDPLPPISSLKSLT